MIMSRHVRVSHLLVSSCLLIARSDKKTHRRAPWNSIW